MYTLQLVYVSPILTDMKKLLVIFDEKTFNLIPAKINKSEHIRQAVQAYNQHISPDGKKNLVQAMVDIRRQHDELDEKLVTLTAQVEYLTTAIDRLNNKIPDVF